MSNKILSDIEAQIQKSFNEFSVAVKENSNEKAKENSATILALLEIRNKKCKLLK